jgi:hypothetical protein
MSFSPAGVPVVGPGTPYITPAMLTAAPTGISWSTIPERNATPQQQLAEQLNICARATAMVDGYCNQPLRATIDVESLQGPGEFRCQNYPTGVTRLLLSRGPVVAVISGRVSSAAAFPPSWSDIPANQFRPEKPLLGVYGTTAPGTSGGGGQSVLLAPGWVTWLLGRSGCWVEATYLNGWPHASLTAAATAGANTIAVDDITGWVGAVGNLYDGGQQESVAVTAVTPTVSGAISGPGSLTLATTLSYSHSDGVLVSALPQSVQQSAIYFGIAQALTRGATATAVQSLSGSSAGSGPGTSAQYTAAAQALIHTYRRVI